MAKVKSNALWNGLAPGQRELLEEWLFEEKLGYAAALERARKEFGFAGSVSSLRRFYQRTARERLSTAFAEAAEQAGEIEAGAASVGALRRAALKIMAQLFLRRITEAPEAVREWDSLARLLLQSEENELRRQVKDEDNDIRRSWLALARERFHLDVLEEAQKALPELKALERARADPQVTKFARNKMMNLIRIQMFGPTAPELLPESPEEEAEQNEAARKTQEENNRKHERLLEEYRERQKFEMKNESGHSANPNG